MKTTTRLLAIATGLLLSFGTQAAEPDAERKAPELAPIVEDVALPISSRELAANCAMLDDPKLRVRMDGLLYKLLIMCGRQDELGRVKSEKFKSQAGKAPGTDTLVNDPTGEFGATQTQNETSLARNEVTGTLCSGFNDAFSGVTTTGGFTGFARSVDDGVTFDDRGALSQNSNGDPSLVWRRLDGNFYFATLHTSGLGLWRSTDDCGTFDFIGLIHAGTGDDKEILTVDNDPASPFYGRMHVSFIDFNAGARIYNTFSSDGGANWSAPLALSAVNAPVQGAWPGVAPDGTVYVSWGRFDGNNVSVEMSRSNNGGVSFTPTARPLDNEPSPRASGPTSACGRPALAGNIRYLASPQLVVAPNGDVAVVYSYDPDGQDTGDVVDVFFRRSTDQGATWEPEIRLNDDSTERDQFFPTLSVGPSGRYVAAWYDRRLDENNIMLDYYARVSSDGGATWQPAERVSDESSPVYIDPGLASCYHGDYDQQIQSESVAYIQWADDRAVRSGHNDPDVYLDRNTLGPDFSVGAAQNSAFVCAPNTAQYTINVGQFEGFSSPITLSTSGLPAGTADSFSVNPVNPGGSSLLSVIAAGTPAAGSYTIGVDGTDGSATRSAQLSYVLSTEIPGVPVPTAPADGATNQSTMPVLTWDAVAQASNYAVDVATDAAFTSIVESGMSQTNSYMTEMSLDPQTTYYWRVSADNSCGAGTGSAVSSFTTSATVCSGTSFPILDLQGTSQTLSVSNSGIIESLTVSVDASHTWVGDVTLTLVNEDTGTSVVLMDRPGVPASAEGCSLDGINVEFDDDSSIPVETECNGAPPAIGGILNPEGTLADFAGESFGATWRLDAFDSFNGDPGTVNTWCLTAALEDTGIDTDGDGIDDSADNCTLVENADQRDTNGDGFGNACDPDLDNNGVVNFADIALWTPLFNTPCGDVDEDFDGSGSCNFADYALFPDYFLQPPGPSGVAP